MNLNKGSGNQSLLQGVAQWKCAVVTQCVFQLETNYAGTLSKGGGSQPCWEFRSDPSDTP